MAPWLSILAFGFVLGMRHATDADHVVAVTTIVCRARSLSAAAPIGAIWGLGHTLTILVLGGAIIVFGLVIPPRLGLSMELCVGFMLIGLGAVNVGAGQHPHGDGVEPHAHGDGALPHAHGAADVAFAHFDRALGRLDAYRFVRPLVVGIVHGLAGSAAVALLVLGTIESPLWAVGYLAVFGVGTIGGMLIITSAMALPFVYAAGRFERIHRALGVVAGLLSIAFGVFLVYDIGFVRGLFTGDPRWTPE